MRNFYGKTAHGEENAIKSITNTNIYGKSAHDYTPTAGERIGYGAAGLGLGLAQGAASAVEGITDFFAGGFLQLTGQKEAAKEIYENSWSGDFRKWIDREINPDGNKAFSTYLDIVSGVGNAGAQVGFAALTGGSSAALGAGDTAVKVASLAPLFASSMGSGTAEAVQTTGELGFKENAYGALTGATELATEYVLGAGGKILRGAGLLGDAGSEAVKSISKHAITRGVISSAGGEFAEEAISEGLSVGWKRLTGVDPNAQLNMGDIIRAGTMGAVSGGVLGLGNAAITSRMASNAGRKILANGTERATLAEADALVKAAKKTTSNGFLNMDAVARVEKALSLYREDSGMPESRRAYYLGQMSQGLYEIGMYASAQEYAANAVATVAQGGDAAKALIDGANAMFEETLGRKLTAEDFSAPDSIGAKMLASVSVYESLLTPTDAELIDGKIREDSAAAYSEASLRADAEQMSAGNGTALYRLPDGNYAVVTRRKGDGAFSVGLMKKGEGTQIYTPMHGLKTVDNVVEAIGKLKSGTATVAPSVATPKAPTAPETKAEPKKPEAPASTDSVSQKKETVKKETANKARKAMSEGSEANKPETKTETKKQKEPKKPEPKKPETSNVQKSEKDAGNKQNNESPAFSYTDKQVNTNLKKYATYIYKSVAKMDKARGVVSPFREAAKVGEKYYITDGRSAIILDSASDYMHPSSVEYSANVNKSVSDMPPFDKLFDPLVKNAKKSEASAADFLNSTHDKKVSDLGQTYIENAYFDSKLVRYVTSAIKNPEFYTSKFQKTHVLVVNGDGAVGVVLPVASGTMKLDYRHGTEPADKVSRSVAAHGETHEKIRPGMTDAERAEILRKRALSLSAEVDNEQLSKNLSKVETTIEELSQMSRKQAKPLVKKLGDEFGVHDKKYRSEEFSIEFVHSKNNLDESATKQRMHYDNFAKMLSCLDQIIENAVGIEVHNRNGRYKTDPTLRNMYVLLSAFDDGASIVPVKLEIKEFSDKPNALYVAIALESTKKDEVVKVRDTENGVAQTSLSSTISIPDFVQKINPSDGSFLKYLPDELLTSEQKRSKEIELAKDAIKESTSHSVSKSSAQKKTSAKTQKSPQNAENTVENETDEAVEARMSFKRYDGATFDAKEISAARADFKRFDALPSSVRKSILIMRRSAAEAKIPAEKVKGLTRLMAAYHFGAVFSSDIKSNGFWMHGKNLTVINPNNIYQSTFGHELSHRVEDYDGYDKFAAAVEALVGKKRMKAEMDQYLADYNAAAEANGWKKWDAEKNAEDLHREAVASMVGKLQFLLRV